MRERRKRGDFPDTAENLLLAGMPPAENRKKGGQFQIVDEEEFTRRRRLNLASVLGISIEETFSNLVRNSSPPAKTQRLAEPANRLTQKLFETIGDEKLDTGPLARAYFDFTLADYGGDRPQPAVEVTRDLLSAGDDLFDLGLITNFGDIAAGQEIVEELGPLHLGRETGLEETILRWVNLRRYILDAGLMSHRISDSVDRLRNLMGVDQGQGWYIPDVRFLQDGKTIFQIDGAIVDPSFGGAARWLTSSGERGNSSNAAWQAVEVRVAFTARFQTSKPRGPRRKDLRQLVGKIGDLAIWHHEREIPFRFPEVLHVVYPRALRPTLTFAVPFDGEFMSSWFFNLVKIRDKLAQEDANNDDDRKKVETLIQILNNYFRLKNEKTRQILINSRVKSVLDSGDLEQSSF